MCKILSNYVCDANVNENSIQIFYISKIIMDTFDITFYSMRGGCFSLNNRCLPFWSIWTHLHGGVHMFNKFDQFCILVLEMLFKHESVCLCLICKTFFFHFFCLFGQFSIFFTLVLVFGCYFCIWTWTGTFIFYNCFHPDFFFKLYSSCD